MSRKGETVNFLPTPEFIKIPIPRSMQRESKATVISYVNGKFEKEIANHPERKPGCRRKIKTVKTSNSEVVYEIYYVANVVYSGND